jgi:hypothetical protein
MSLAYTTEGRWSVSIELHCNSCGKLVRAPRDAAGRRGKCPACGNILYIPTPQEEIEELPLAPEDAADEARQAALEEERRRLDWVLAKERSAGGDTSSSPPPPPRASAGKDRININDAVIGYLKAMTSSDLDGASRFLSLLRVRRDDTLAVVDRLAADQMTPPALGNIPMGVYQGFLKNLRTRLT